MLVAPFIGDVLRHPPAALPLTARCLRPCRFPWNRGDCAPPALHKVPGFAVPAIGRLSSCVEDAQVGSEPAEYGSPGGTTRLAQRASKPLRTQPPAAVCGSVRPIGIPPRRRASPSNQCRTTALRTAILRGARDRRWTVARGTAAGRGQDVVAGRVRLRRQHNPTLGTPFARADAGRGPQPA